MDDIKNFRLRKNEKKTSLLNCFISLKRTKCEYFDNICVSLLFYL